MIKLFPKYKEVELTEDKDNENYEWYKGVVFDPDAKEFKVISGKFTDKKDFYEKLTKRGYIVRKAYEKDIWDWIQKNAKNTLDAYLMCSTAVSKWRDTNMLDDYYLKLMNDFPRLNREKIKGNPNTRGKDESVITEDEDFDVQLLRPEDDVYGNDVLDIKVYGMENLEVDPEEGNLYANIYKKCDIIKNYILENNLDPEETYCYVWKRSFTRDDLAKAKQMRAVLGKAEYLSTNSTGDKFISELKNFIAKKDLTLINDDYVNELSHMSHDQIHAEKEKLAGFSNINTLSTTDANHLYMSWQEIEDKRGLATDEAKYIAEVGIELKEWNKFFKNTPVADKTPLKLTPETPFQFIEKLQEVNIHTNFKKFGLSTYDSDYVEAVSSNTIENRYTQAYQNSNIISDTDKLVKKVYKGTDDISKALRSHIQRLYNNAGGKDLDIKKKAINREKLAQKGKGTYAWKDTPDFLKNAEKIYDLNSRQNTATSVRNDAVDKAMDMASREMSPQVGDVNTGNTKISPASRLHGGDSETTHASKIDNHRSGQIQAKANEILKKKKENELQQHRSSLFKAFKAEKKKGEEADKNKLITLSKMITSTNKELNRIRDEIEIADTKSSEIHLSADEERKLNKLLAAMDKNTPVSIRSMHTYDPNKMINNFVNNYKKHQESAADNFKKLFEAMVNVPVNYDATVMYVNEPTHTDVKGAIVPMAGTITEEELSKLTMEVHDTLNQKLFDIYNDSVYEDVQIAMMKVAKDFYDTLEFTPELTDVYFTGSCANYNYNDDSDIDIHLVFDFERVGINAEILTEYFKLKKKVYNTEHNITIKGYPVEVGVENVNTPLISTGVYSLKQNKWIKKPSKDTFANNGANLGDYEQSVNYIERAINTQDPEQILRLWKEIAKSRREALAAEGETAPDNIIFKKLRANGYLERLRDAYYNYASENLSLEALEEIE